MAVETICREVGTPVFIYSRATLERHFKVFEEPFQSLDHLVCFSVKANSNISILRIFADMGGGTDIVSGGELYRALKAGIEPGKIVYSGVGKTAEEIDQALDAGILMFNVESEDELETLNDRAIAKNRKARVALRVNPDVDPKTHPYISTGLKTNKFGIDVERSFQLYQAAKEMEGLKPEGVDCHIGSQLTDIDPILEAIDRLAALIGKLRSSGIDIKYLDIGGGLGISYDAEEPPPPSEYGEAIVGRVKRLGVKLILEPGRVLVGNAGILATKVLYQKSAETKHFVIVDSAMNDLIRPSLYDAYHGILKVRKSPDEDRKITADIVGPICESGDFVAQNREIDQVASGDFLAVQSAGAYGFTMSSNYNSRPKAAEVLVDGSEYFIIRERESYEDLIRGERIPNVILETR